MEIWVYLRDTHLFSRTFSTDSPQTLSELPGYNRRAFPWYCGEAFNNKKELDMQDLQAFRCLSQLSGRKGPNSNCSKVFWRRSEILRSSDSRSSFFLWEIDVLNTWWDLFFASQGILAYWHIRPMTSWAGGSKQKSKGKAKGWKLRRRPRGVSVGERTTSLDC